MIVRILIDVVQAYLVVLLVRIVLTWFPINPWSRLSRVVRVLGAVTDPVLVPVRRVLPPLRLGGGGAALDLSPLAVFIALEIVLSVLRRF
ncbi:MAG: YggT family protein [Actinomycetota bacterium]|nr:YggT family protein [Actinomycetota bacterium]